MYFVTKTGKIQENVITFKLWYTTGMNNEKCIMIIIKQRVQSLPELPEEFSLESDGPRQMQIKDQTGNRILAASLIEGNDFGTGRLTLELTGKTQSEAVYSVLAGKMCQLYDRIPGKYPLYIVLDPEEFDQIRWLSRLGFTPYLGESKDHSEQENKKIWQKITDALYQQDRE